MSCPVQQAASAHPQNAPCRMLQPHRPLPNLPGTQPRVFASDLSLPLRNLLGCAEQVKCSFIKKPLVKLQFSEYEVRTSEQIAMASCKEILTLGNQACAFSRIKKHLLACLTLKSVSLEWREDASIYLRTLSIYLRWVIAFTNSSWEYQQLLNDVCAKSVSVGYTGPKRLTSKAHSTT